MRSKLPPWKIFRKALSLLWERRAFALLICLPILLFVALFSLPADLGVIRYIPASELNKEQVPKYIKYLYFAGRGAGFIILGFFFSVIAVYWHRSILLQENSIRGIPIRIDAVVWRYIGYCILIGLIWAALWLAIIAVAGVVSVAAQAASGTQVILGILLIPLFLWLGVVTFRLSLVLPAAAIGQRGVGFAAA